MGVDYGDKDGDMIYGWIPPNVNCRDKYGVERCRDPCPADRRLMQECVILYQLVQHASWTSVLAYALIHIKSVVGYAMTQDTITNPTLPIVSCHAGANPKEPSGCLFPRTSLRTTLWM